MKPKLRTLRPLAAGLAGLLLTAGLLSLTEIQLPTEPLPTDRTTIDRFPTTDHPSQPDIAPPTEDLAHSPQTPASPERGAKGPERMRRFLAELHQPYGAVLPPGRLEQALDEVRAVPAAIPHRSDTGWELIGPSGILTPSGTLFSGRVLDIDGLNGPGTLVAAASGGLWGYDFLFPSPLSDGIPTLWTGTFAVDPADENTILLGTGERWIYAGSGLWKTTDGGANWAQKVISPNPGAFTRVRYGLNGQLVHAASEFGYYRSTDGGETWQNTLVGTMTDIAFVPMMWSRLWGTVVGQGLLVSTDAGQNWSSVTDPLLPTDVDRSAVTVCAAHPSVVYVAFSHADENGEIGMEGIYKTLDGGTSWTDVSPPENYMGAQGWYDNVIAVSPTDPSRVLAGGVVLMQTTDGGVNWTEVIDDHLHVDYHALQWAPDGLSVWAGHDGGWSYSMDRGEPGTWTSDTNYLPITQLYHMDAYGRDWATVAVGGGAQDNCVPISVDGGNSWDLRLGGDGSGFAILSLDPDYMFASFGYVDPGICFPRMRSINGGLSWHEWDSGLTPPGSWFPVMRLDGDHRLYTNNYAQVFSTLYHGGVWVPENPGPFTADVREITVSQVFGEPVIYACLDSPNFRERLMVKESEYWGERSNGLPANIMVRKVATHPNDSQRVHALMNGYVPSGTGKVFLSTNRGVVWTDVTGNLPNVPLTDLVAHPDDPERLYVGTEFGFFRTLDGGATWERYNLNIPSGVWVTEMKVLDQRGDAGGGVYIVASTFGRSIWKRNILLSDPTSGVPEDQQLPPRVAILRAAPNPFRAHTVVGYQLAERARVEAGVFDPAGRRVRSLLAGERPAGESHVGWDGMDEYGEPVEAGVYLVRIEAAGEVVTRKVTMLR